jgi:hypothetical protein
MLARTLREASFLSLFPSTRCLASRCARKRGHAIARSAGQRQSKVVSGGSGASGTWAAAAASVTHRLQTVGRDALTGSSGRRQDKGPRVVWRTRPVTALAFLLPLPGENGKEKKKQASGAVLALRRHTPLYGFSGHPQKFQNLCNFTCPFSTTVWLYSP